MDNRAYLNGAKLYEVNFYGADLVLADLSETNLSGADFNQATVWSTRFVDVDLSLVKGLDAVNHQVPSTIGIDTIYRSKGQIPEIFLRGAGVPDTFITYTRSLVGQRIDYYTCFISYSTKNQDFAERLHTDLQSKNVRCWFAPHDMRTGDKIRERIDDTIRLYDKLLLILSENALTSSWVEDEVEIAFEKERQLKLQGRPQTVLFPVRLDNTIFSTTTAWAKEVCKRHITNFTAWKQYDDYQKALSRLLRDLETEAKK